MIGELIGLLIAAACALFVLSLPLSKTETGSTLRRWAGVCLVLAFLPSLIGGLFFPASPVDGSTAAVGPASASPAGDALSGLGCIAAVIIAALIAYGILKLRSRFASKSKPRDPWESFFNRGGGKRPFTMNPNARRTRGPFGYDDEDDG
jgi:hypothetical protein